MANVSRIIITIKWIYTHYSTANGVNICFTIFELLSPVWHAFDMSGAGAFIIIIISVFLCFISPSQTIIGLLHFERANRIRRGREAQSAFNRQT